MDFTTWMLVKAGVFLLVIAVIQFIRGFNEATGRQSPTAEPIDQSED